MKVRFLPFLMLPILGMAQANSNGEVPLGGNTSRERQTLEIKRNTSFNLEEIKVRWKKVALENCPGAPCLTVIAPGAPTGVVATSGDASASVAFVAPSNTGGSAITGYTVTSNPGNISANGSLSPINVTGLINGTTYTFSVVATNAVGNSVASVASTGVLPAPSFIPCPSSIGDIDLNNYTIVTIGTQCWTKQNLKVSKYNDGTAIPLNNTYTSGTVSTVWAGLTTGAYTIYGNETSSGTNATNYGYLYNWYAAAGIVTSGGVPTNNICPTGYHVPTDSDWNKLVKFIDSGADTSSTSGTQSTTAGDKLKKNDALWNTNTGTNDFLFSALPGGYRKFDGSFSGIRDNTFFWSATENDITFAGYRNLSIYDGNVGRFGAYKSFGASVRCLRD